MNKAVVVFVTEEERANRLMSERVVVSGDVLTVSPLVTPTTRIRPCRAFLLSFRMMKLKERKQDMETLQVGLELFH